MGQLVPLRRGAEVTREAGDWDGDSDPGQRAQRAGGDVASGLGHPQYIHRG